MLLDYARLNLDDAGNPRSERYHDIYYSGNGFAETEHTYINGNRLHERFARCTGNITIGEIGYGTGLNLIHTADAFLHDAPPSARLHYLSFERHPIATSDLARLWQNWPQPALRAAILAQNPHNHAGHHLLKIHPRIHLHLILGDIRDTLPPLRARVDAWYLDGFAPAKNPDCWTPALMQEIARHSAPGATIATFSAAATVRDALSQAGFTPEKIPGYGAKRDMLTATLTTLPAPRPHWNNQPAAADGPVAIIGAGIAGSTTARALAESGRRVTLYHSDAHPAASHVPLAVPYLNPDSEDSPDRPYQLATWHHAMRALHTYPRNIYNPCGVTNHAENPREIRRQQALLNAQLLNADEISGNATDLTYPRGGVIHLPALLAAL
ncbi:MAG: FAD-dependent oxidoreductase, partial [Cardiobacterium sp.]